MSEFINNRELTSTKSERQNKLKELILQLHDGRNFDEVKNEFEKVFGKVSASEISDLEQALIKEGLAISEVQRLCDVHSAVFKGSIDDIHGITPSRGTIGHPINTIYRENAALKQFLSVKFSFHMDLFNENDHDSTREKLIKDINLLYDVDKHYLRKENLLFPYLEKYGIYGPGKVMWGVDDEIRRDIKNLLNIIKDNTISKDTILSEIEKVIYKVNEMIFKEENILLPMAEEKLTQDEWFKIQEESNELGYTLIDKPEKWVPKKVIEMNNSDNQNINNNIPDGNIHFETGVITLKQLDFMLNTLPVDITFIDEFDVVRYFSHGKERIFPRTKAVIGRTVQNCHPPKSVHVVETILEDFKSGKKDHEDFWIKMKGIFVYIRYFAVRDEQGKYLGTLEFTQEISTIKALDGEKRLLSE
ncbi:MAG: hypothetical protein K0Q49_197 [Haloplasmataceae bacterium]|nr:hypothetical protein [Haloplasmataceae bacterium]